MRKITTIVIHCSDSDFGDAKLIDEWHRKRGFNGIGYHYVILNGVLKASDEINTEKDGLVELGRPLEEVGAHVKGYNYNSIGICLIGKNSFTEKQFKSLINILKVLRENFKTINIRRIKGHREFNSKKTCPNFNVAAIREILTRFKGV